jgi:diaminohydroxyphosphoribosylaminopyrimidine deaminase/5-amino-6-(5-phosphoribosylamino)uracil reductase
MRLALAAARRASGRTFPNPPVGAIVFRGDRLLGRGWTRPAGGSHAEIVALRAAARRFGARALRGASLAVTLEPCNHVGRTGPCCEALLAAGIGRVLVGHRDPNPHVAGGGLRRLRAAGVAVYTGILEEACREQHRGFLSVLSRGRPFVALKLAATLDGRIATARGESRWITGPRARALVHRLRARADAVVIGSGTALADDPELTARVGARVLHRPVPVVVDSRLRLPPDARCLRGHGPGGALVVGARSAPATRRRALEAAGARVLMAPSRGGHAEPRAVARLLARAGLTDVLLEGGGALAAAWLRAGIVDEVHWFVSARLLGGDARPALGGLAVARLADAVALEAPLVRRIGGDVYVRGRLRGKGER